MCGSRCWFKFYTNKHNYDFGKKWKKKTNYYCCKWFFVRKCSFRGGVSDEHLMRIQALDSNSRTKPRHHGSFPQTKNGRGLSKMILDLAPTMISRKNTTEGNVDFMTRPSKVDWQDPRRGIDGQEGHGSSKMIQSREASLEEDVMTSLKDGGLDPRSWWPPIEDEVYAW